MKLFLFLLLPLLPIQAADVVFAWEPNAPDEQVSEYVIYQLEGEEWVEVTRTNDITATLREVEPGRYVYAVAAANAWGVSPRSNPIVTPERPSAPKNAVIVEVIVTVTTE